MNAKVNISNRAGASFPVRRMDFEFGEVPRYWANGDAALTHFMTASALFPEGEQFFVNGTRMQFGMILNLLILGYRKKLVLLLVRKRCILKSIWHSMHGCSNFMVMMYVNWKHKQLKSFNMVLL